MQTHQNHPTIGSLIQKQDSKIIDTQKIKTILSKKLQDKIPNPEQIVQALDEQISYQIQMTEHEIQKERQRQNKIHLVQQRQLKARSSLKEKIQSKLEKSQKKKASQEKTWLEGRLKARKLKEEFFEGRKQQIYQNDLRKRLERFKQIKAENDPKLQNSQEQTPKKQRSSLLRRSLSQRSSFGNAIEKSKQLEELQYFKKLGLLEKRKIYEKLEPKVHVSQALDKRDWIEKINSQSQSKFIQKLGDDLWKIQQARKKKEKQISIKLEKVRKQAQLKEEQREYRLQILKSDINENQKKRKEVLSKKNERFLTIRNKSTPTLMDRNFSYASEFQDNFGESTKGNFLQSVSKISKTLENFNQSKSIERAKAEDYLVKQKEEKVKREAINIISQVLRQQKTQLLMK